MNKSKGSLLLLCGILGCVLMGAGDWLMIWGDTSFEGALPWLTAGVAEIPAWRNSLALALSFPAVICYALGLYQVGLGLKSHTHRRTYSFLTTLGMAPWLCLHLLYVMILFLFAHLGGDAAPCEALFAQFSWVVLVSEVLMVLPFLYLVVRTARGETVWSRKMAWSNVLVFYLILKGLTMLLPDTPFRLAFTNGLMSEAMALWFLGFLLAGRK